MNETPGADYGAFNGWFICIVGVVVALATDGEPQTVSMFVAVIGLGIALFARSTKPLEQAVMSNAGTGGGFCGLIGLMLLITVVMLLIAGSVLVVGGVLP